MHRIALLVVIALLTVSAGHSSAPASDWAINATAIEACSCPHFCICYFNAHPAAHHEDGKTEHYCKFNNAYKVNKGHYGNLDLTGAKARGEVPPTVDPELLFEVCPAVALNRQMAGLPLDETFVTHLVDHILIPVLTARPSPA